MMYNITLVQTINAFHTQMKHLDNFILVGQRYDWANPRVIDDLSFEHFFSNIKIEKHYHVSYLKDDTDTQYKCSLHQPTGIDYVVHSKTTLVSSSLSFVAFLSTAV